MKDKEIRKFIDEGYLRITVIFEIIGHPKKHVEDTLKAYIANIKGDKDLEVISEEYEEAEELEGDVFSVVAETQMLIRNIEKLTELCINYSPASIEIMEPDKLTLEQRDLNHWLNDMLAKIHEVGIIQKQLNSQKEGLIRNFNAMTRNAIILVLKEPSDLSTISKKIGMIDEHTEKFVEALIKEKKVEKKKNLYQLIH